MKDYTVSDVSAEQQARDMLERIGVENAQSFTAGDLVELANLISESKRLTAHASALEAWAAKGDRILGSGAFGAAFSLGAWWADRPWRKS